MLIARPADPGTYRVDNWVMSCRVMERTVENGVLDHLVRWTAARGCARLEAECRRSSKNDPVAELFPTLGFRISSVVSDATAYIADLSAGAPAPNRLIELID